MDSAATIGKIRAICFFMCNFPKEMSNKVLDSQIHNIEFRNYIVTWHDNDRKSKIIYEFNLKSSNHLYRLNKHHQDAFKLEFMIDRLSWFSGTIH